MNLKRVGAHGERGCEFLATRSARKMSEFLVLLKNDYIFKFLVTVIAKRLKSDCFLLLSSHFQFFFLINE
jgi:hypothetical protein